MATVHVFCSRPGMHRGGRANPRHAEYKMGDHSTAQLRELLDDPETTVVFGASAVEVEDYVAAAEKKEAEAKAKKAEAEAAAAAAAAAKAK